MGIREKVWSHELWISRVRRHWSGLVDDVLGIRTTTQTGETPSTEGAGNKAQVGQLRCARCCQSVLQHAISSKRSRRSRRCQWRQDGQPESHQHKLFRAGAAVLLASLCCFFFFLLAFLRTSPLHDDSSLNVACGVLCKLELFSSLPPDSCVEHFF